MERSAREMADAMEEEIEKSSGSASAIESMIKRTTKGRLVLNAPATILLSERFLISCQIRTNSTKKNQSVSDAIRFALKFFSNRVHSLNF